MAYVFIHVLPALNTIREFQEKHPSHFKMLFPEYNVYLWTMVGFLVFYGLERMAAGSRVNLKSHEDENGGAVSWPPLMQMAGFALYTWVLTYMMVWTGKSALGLFLFAGAMGMHIFMIASSLSSHYHKAYDNFGAYLLALASLAGWASALTLNIPIVVVLSLVAFVIGGVVVNSAIAELPKEKEGRYLFFAAGATIYTALLLVLSHFEKIG